MTEEKREAAVEALDKFWSDKTGEWLGTNTLRKMVDVVAAALSTKQEAGEVCGAGAAAFRGRQSLPAALQDWLADIEEYLRDRHDIRDGVPGGPHPLPNDEMALSSALKCALGEEP